MKMQIETRPSAHQEIPNENVVIEGIDGRLYFGKSIKAVLQSMRAASWGMPARDLNGWMRQVAERVYGWCKVVIRTDKPENFIADLNAASVITVRRNGWVREEAEVVDQGA